MIQIKSTIQGNRIHIDKKIHKQALQAIAKKLGKIFVDTAISDFREKRVNDREPSPMIQSFSYDTSIDGTEVELKVSVDVPYAQFPNYGFTTRAGNWWEGHHFMEEGAKEVHRQQREIIKKEFAKRFYGVVYQKVKVV